MHGEYSGRFESGMLHHIMKGFKMSEEEDLRTTYPVLYILARTDIDSMNPGKLAAQCGHAVSMFMYRVCQTAVLGEPDFKEWIGIDDNRKTRGFGTKIVLDAGDVSNLKFIIDNAQVEGLMADLVVDPTYPLYDGSFVHELSLPTCGYIFGDKLELIDIVDGLGLYK